MKRLFTLTVFTLSLALSGYAQNIRKTWDFRTGFSPQTVANLNADMQQNGATGAESHWRNYEKDASKASDQTFWCADNGTITDDNGNAVTTVDGQKTVIKELEGLNVKGIKAKGFTINYNYAQAENANSPSGMYPYGKSFMWLNGKNLTFTFTALKGDSVRMGLESHKNSEGRGLNISVDGQKLTPVSGNNVPTYYEDVAWILPDDTPGVDDYCTVTVTTTNGCHIYYIITGAGDKPQDLTKKIGYLYTGTTDGDFAYQTITANADNKVTAIDAATTTLTKDELMKYDVTVVAPSLPADNANVAVLKDAMPWTPVLNLNGDLYEPWGYGRALKGDDVFGATTMGSHQLFAGMTLIPGEDAGLPEGQSGIVFSTDAPITAVQLGNHFRADDILGTTPSDTSAVTIHAHNIYHNGYLYLPYNSAALGTPNTENDATATLINNAVALLAGSKADITANPAPTYSLAYSNFKTEVTIADARADAAIYYTTDGSEPQVGGTRYTGPFTVEKETLVRAIAVSEGFNPSAVADSTIHIYEQAKKPAISVEEENDMSTITLACETPGTQIWYNFSGSNDSTMSTKYTAPIVVRDHKVLTAFATSPAYVQSEPLTKNIYLKNDKVYIDIASHFDANYNGQKSNGDGLFSWGKSAANSTVTTDSIVGTYIDADGIEQIQYYSYARPEEVYPAEGENEWVVKSNGQSVLWQNLKPGSNPGDGSAYNPATAEDVDTLISSYCIQFYKFTDNQYNARVESTKKFKGPFNVVTFLGNANADGNIQRMGVEVSTDGKNWELAGDTIAVSCPKRLWRKYTAAYYGTDEVYVRLAQLGGNSGAQCYDIYVMTEGEQSLVLEKELAAAYDQHATGISNATAAKAEVVAIYSINGTRLNSLQRGINIVRMSDGTARKVLVK